MTTYEIHENGMGRFATIEAESADKALEIAEAQYPRLACDYNGYVGPVTWAAFGPDQNHAEATREVEVV